MFVCFRLWVIFPFEGLFRHNSGINHCEQVYIGRKMGTLRLFYLGVIIGKLISLTVSL